MDPTLPSQAVTMATEFGSPTYTQNESPQNRVDFREARYSLSLYRKPVEGSSSPSRKKSRFFDTLLLRSPRKENIADENGSPKPLRKRKSIADFLAFPSTRSRKVPDGNDVDPGSRNKRSGTTSPLKRNALQSASPSRINRRKSLGDILGSISSRVSPRRNSTLNGRRPDWYNHEHELSANVGLANGTSSMSGANSLAADQFPVLVDGQSDDRGLTQLSNRESGVDMNNYHPPSLRKYSISSSMLCYEESPRKSTQVDKHESRVADSPPKLTNKGKERDVNVPNPVGRDETQANASSIPIDKGKEKAVDISTPINRGRAKTPDSYLNLLIAAYEHKTPDSYLRELLKASISNNSARSSSCPRRHLALGEESLFWETGDSPQMEDRKDGEDEEEFSAPPPYTLNDFSKVELGEVRFRENPLLQTSDRTEIQTSVETVREVDSFEESPGSSPNIDTEFRLREGNRKERHEKLMTQPRRSWGSSDESIEKRVKLTVAKMTKNFHMVTSSEESWGDDTASTKMIDRQDFETDQKEVWDSIIMGTRTLQEAKPFQLLRSFPSGERLRHPPLGKVLQDSIQLRQLSEDGLTTCTKKGVCSVSEASASKSLQKQKFQPSGSRSRKNSSAMVRVEFPKTVNLPAHAEMYESKNKAIIALYEYKLGELSNFCTYDSTRNTIFAHALESSVPNPAVLRETGLEVLWLPMRGEITQIIQFKEMTREKNELSRDEQQSPMVAERDKIPEAGQERLVIDNSGFSLDPNTLLAHNEGVVRANLDRFDRHESQLELEAEFINPHSRSSSLPLNPASPQREQELSIFDDDFFLEVDPDVARGFLGSQYSEGSQYSSISDAHLLSENILGTDLPSELLWSLDDEGQDATPVKTWAELARDYLAKHPAQTVPSSEDEEGQDVKPVRTWVELARAYLAEYPPQPIQGFGNNRKSTDEDYMWHDQFEASSGRSSPIDPSTEQAEGINSANKDHSLKGRHSRRLGLTSILADEVSLKLPKRSYLSGRKAGPRSRRERPIVASEDMVDLVATDATADETSMLDTSELLEPLIVRECSAYEVSSIPFPTKEAMDGSSRQSSISFTSYIEAERARERLYQTHEFLPRLRAETKAEDKKPVTEPCVRPGVTLEEEKDGTELTDTIDTVGRQLDSQDSQELLGGTEVESEYSGRQPDRLRSSVLVLASKKSSFRPTEGKKHLAGNAMPRDPESRVEDSGSSAIALPVGFKFTEHRKQLIVEGNPKETEMASEISGSSAIPIPTGFRFTNHRRQIMRSEDSESPAISCLSSFSLSAPITGEERSQRDEEIPNPQVIENVALTRSSRLQKTLDINVPISIKDLAGRKENHPECEGQVIVIETDCEKPPSEQIQGDLPCEPRGRESEFCRLATKVLDDLDSFEPVRLRLNECLSIIPPPSEDFTGGKEKSPEPESRKSKESGVCDGLASEEIRRPVAFPFCRDSLQGPNPSRKAQIEGKAGCEEPSSEMVGDPDVSPFRKSLGQPRNLSWKAQMEDLSIRVVDKAARQDHPAKQGGRVGALVDIFQARGIMPSLRPALHRKVSPTPLANKAGSRSTIPIARIVTPSGNTYHPAGTVCVPAGCPLSRSAIKRVPTPIVPFRPSSSVSSMDTDVSELFGEKLERAENHSVESVEGGLYEEI